MANKLLDSGALPDSVQFLPRAFLPYLLQVWLGRAISDPTHLAAAAERDLLLPPQLPPAAEGLPASGLLAPGRRCTVAYILDDASCSNGSQAGSGTLGAAPGGSSVPVARLAASFEEQQRQECAERLCRAVGLFYRVDADDAGIAGVCVCVCCGKPWERSACRIAAVPLTSASGKRAAWNNRSCS